MKFTETLATHLTPEWRSQYINYEELKQMLNTAVEEAPPQPPPGYYDYFDEIFFAQCERELHKVNAFFAEKLSEVKRQQVALKTELRQSMKAAHQHGHASRYDITKNMTRSKTKDFKFAFSEVYLNLVLLQNYQTLNHTGFRKILKKRDKLLKNDSGRIWFNANVNNAPFYTNKEIMALIRDTENTFTYNLEHGDRARAMKRLRVPPLEVVSHPWVSFRVGLYSGVLFVLMCTLLLSLFMVELSGTDWNAFMRLYRAPFSATIYLALMSINIYGWRRAGVNHVLIFELNPRQYLTAVHVMEMALMLISVLMISVLGYLHASYVKIPPYAFPLGALVLLILFVINPLPIFNRSSRYWFLRIAGRLLCVPFVRVNFADFWLADQLNSLAYCLVDFAYVICFYCTDSYNWYAAEYPEMCVGRNRPLFPVVITLPAWFRFAQCLRRYHDTGQMFPFIWNAGKYSMSFIVSLFGFLMAGTRLSYERFFDNPFVWFFIVFSTLQTIYLLLWDMWMDFGVFRKWKGEHIFLRDHLLYNPGFYYFAMIMNFCCRWFWVLKLYLYVQGYLTVFNSNTIASLLEMMRRYIWNYFRLENEHLFNAGKFRAVRDIFIAPLDPNDEDTLDRIMNEVVEERVSVSEEQEKKESKSD